MNTTPTLPSSRQTPSPMDLIGTSFIMEPNNRAEFVLGLQRRIELEESRRRRQQQQQQQQHEAANSNSVDIVSPAQIQPLPQQMHLSMQEPMQQPILHASMQEPMQQPMQPLERIQAMLRPQLQQQQEEEEELQAQQRQQQGPCLSCLMRALQGSGMLNSCWSAAFAELEEAFAIKRVADVLTGDDNGAGADDADTIAVRNAEQQQQRYRQQQQQKQQRQQQQQRQKQKKLTSSRHQPEPTKWQALESLCAMMADLSTCSHKTSAGGL